MRPPSAPTLPPSAAVATGRLGRISTRAVVDAVIGTMLGAVERIGVASHALAVALREALAAELEHSWTTEMDHVNVFQYDNTQVAERDDAADTWTVELQANKAIARHLHSVVREFGRLHGAVTRHYIRAVVRGLEELHRHGFPCGGLSLSNLFLCEGQVQIGGWFPPITVLRELSETHAALFADNPFAQSTLRRLGDATLLEQQQRDIKSLAFLIVEMHTGERVMLSQLTTNNDELLAAFPVHSIERAFILEVLQATATLKTLATHPYLADERVPYSLSSSATSQRELVAFLIEKELTKCRTDQRTDAHQVRTWNAQFEKRFHRKPHADERPATIQRLQQRCHALDARIQELERRSKVLGQSARSSAQLVRSEDPSFEAAVIQIESIPISASVASLGIDTSTPSIGEPGDLVDRRRRSPAQNAFLRELSTNARGSPKAVDTPFPNSGDIVAARERGHELLHQRKEVMSVILGLEQ